MHKKAQITFLKAFRISTGIFVVTYLLMLLNYADRTHCFVTTTVQNTVRQYTLFKVLRASGFIKEIRTNSLSIRKLNEN